MYKLAENIVMQSKILITVALFFSLLLTTGSAVFANYLIPMDVAQKDHLKAYGVVYKLLAVGQKLKILLNYRGGSFLVPPTGKAKELTALANVTLENFPDADYQTFKKKVQTENMNELDLEKAPKVAIYKPPTSEPWDDAVNMVLEYAEIPFVRLWDREVLKGKLSNYDWLHLHHEDFTGQYGKFYAYARNMQWYQQRRLKFEKMAKEMGYTRVADEKRDVTLAIQSYVAKGGFLFAMCSATDTLDISLAAQKIDIIDSLIDGSPITPNFNKKLQFDYTFAFKDFQVYTDPYLYEFSDIDIDVQRAGIVSNKDSFALFEFNSHIDPIPSLLTQNHTKVVKGFLGQTTAFHIDKIKSRVLILGQTLGTNRVKYIYGGYKKGFFSYYAGHDPEDYKHLVGDPPTNLALHKSSPGYRLILNNIFLPAAKKKSKKT